MKQYSSKAHEGGMTLDEHYSDKYFDSWVDDSVASSERVLKILFDIYAPKSVADFGCGRGAWLAACEKFGAKILHGYDGPWVDEKKFCSKNIVFTPVNFEKGFLPKERCDLAMSVEVAEHISEASADNFVTMLAQASDVIVFGAAAKGQGGENHINEQWQSYWIEKFNKKKYECFDIFRPLLWDDKNVDWWYRQNTFLFVKKNISKDIIDIELLKKKEKNVYDIVHPDSFEYRLSLYNIEMENKYIEMKNKYIEIESKYSKAELKCLELENEIVSLKSSKFWKLREIYLKIKENVFKKN